METPVYNALKMMCEIYNRPRISESAAQAYIKACRVSEEELQQRLLDWLRVSPRFPLPCDLMSPVEGEAA